MDVQTLIQESLKVLKENDKARSYFETNIQWLEKQLEYSKKNIIRIALIGVTSSGKSTILNALLGEKLLPAAVRPSSGILITCSKSKHKQAIVYFENKNPFVIKKSNIEKEIDKYGDENNNPRNKYQVKHIDIMTPHFLLDENVQIIDSPGLDAYGLEYHEILTMETLLPSVDLCLYALTMKANADESTFRTLQTVQAYDKPLIIIQNMLDSVEQKKGKGGEIIKTKEQVAFEHKSRINRIIDKVNASTKEGPNIHSLVDIVQISAKNALEARNGNNNKLLQESKLNDLIECLKRNLKKLYFFINKQRKQQTIRHLLDLIEDEKASLHDIDEENTKLKRQSSQLQTFKTEKESIEKAYQNKNKQISSKLETIKLDVNKTIASIDKLGEGNLNQANSYNGSLRKKVSKLEKEIIVDTSNINRQISQSMCTLNINQQDVQNDLLPSTANNNSRFKTKSKIVQRTRTVEKSGPLSKVSRFFGDFLNNDWGYEERTYDVTVLDTVAMKRQIQKDFTEILKELSHFIKHWENRINSYLDKINEELNRKGKEIKQKNEMLLDDMIIYGIIKELESVLKSAGAIKEYQEESKYKNEQRKQTIDSSKSKKITIDSSVFGIYQLTYHFIYSHFNQIWQYCQRHNSNYIPFYQTIIWSWDESSLSQFVRRFLNHSLSENEMLILREKGYLILDILEHRVVLVNESIKSTKELDKVLGEKKYNAYVLVNAMQMGASIKQLKQSHFLIHQKANDGVINWVNQSVVEYKGHNMDEGLRSLYTIINECGPLNHGFTLMNDENPIYSILLLELSRYNKVTVSDEQRLIKQISNKYSYLLRNREMNDCVQLLRSYTSGKGVEVG